VTEAADPTAPVADPRAPSFDEEMKCRRDHCYTGGAAECLATCRKWNHPRRPKEHAACDDNCRHYYGLSECDRACALDRRAFDPAAGAGGECGAKMAACRKCPSGRANVCELDCLTTLRNCEAQ